VARRALVPGAFGALAGLHLRNRAVPHNGHADHRPQGEIADGTSNLHLQKTRWQVIEVCLLSPMPEERPSQPDRRQAVGGMMKGRGPQQRCNAVPPRANLLIGAVDMRGEMLLQVGDRVEDARRGASVRRDQRVATWPAMRRTRGIRSPPGARGGHIPPARWVARWATLDPISIRNQSTAAPTCRNGARRRVRWYGP
jgi:hypothetical protein